MFYYYVIGVWRTLEGRLLGFKTIDKRNLKVEYIHIKDIVNTNKIVDTEYELENFKVEAVHINGTIAYKIEPLCGAEIRYPIIVQDNDKEYVVNPNLVVLYEIDNTGYIVSDGYGLIKFYTYKRLKDEVKSGITIANMKSVPRSEKGLAFISKVPVRSEIMMYNYSVELNPIGVFSVGYNSNKKDKVLEVYYNIVRLMHTEFRLINEAIEYVRQEYEDRSDIFPESMHDNVVSNYRLMESFIRTSKWSSGETLVGWLKYILKSMLDYYISYYISKHSSFDNMIDCLLKQKDIENGWIGLFIEDLVIAKQPESAEVKLYAYSISSKSAKKYREITDREVESSNIELPYFQYMEAFMSNEFEIEVTGIVKGNDKYPDLGIQIWISLYDLIDKGSAEFICNYHYPMTRDRKYVPECVFDYQNYSEATYLCKKCMDEYKEDSIASFNNDTIDIVRDLEGLGNDKLNSAMVACMLSMLGDFLKVRSDVDIIPATIRIIDSASIFNAGGLMVAKIFGFSRTAKKELHAIRIIENGEVKNDLVIGFLGDSGLETARGKSIGTILGDVSSILRVGQSRLSLLVGRHIPNILHECFQTLYPYIVSKNLFIVLAGADGLKCKISLTSWYSHDRRDYSYKFFVGLSKVDGCVYLALEIKPNASMHIGINIDGGSSGLGAVPVARFDTIENAISFFNKYCTNDGAATAGDKVVAGLIVTEANTRGKAEEHKKHLVKQIKDFGDIKNRTVTEYILNCNFLGTSYAEVTMRGCKKNLSELGVIQINPDIRSKLLEQNK